MATTDGSRISRQETRLLETVDGLQMHGSASIGTAL